MKRRIHPGPLFLYCLLTAAACLLVCSKSSPLYPINDWTDANAYFSCGKGMLAGRVMYRDLYEHKGPLLYALHALCCLVDSRTFWGVFLMETLAGALFLMAVYRTLALYGAGRAALIALPPVAVLVYASLSFQQGDSAEELCLPLLAWSLFFLLRWLRQAYPRRMGKGLLVLNGVLCGCVLWIKFTLLGLYVPWIAGMALAHALRRDGKAALSAVGWFALGVAAATAPWLIYFGINGAIVPWLKTYLYDNLFLYQDEPALGLPGRVKAALRAAWAWFAANWAYAAPMALGFLWLTLPRGNGTAANAAGSPEDAAPGDHAGSPEAVPAGVPADAPQRMRTVPIPRQSGNAASQTGAHARKHKAALRENGTAVIVSFPEKAFLWAMAGFAALGVFAGGKSYLYYGFILAAFAALGALPLCALLDRSPVVRPAPAAALAVLCLLAAAPATLAVSPNTPDLLKPRSATMQYQFAAVTAQTPNATLLNYGFMDAGFYTACGITPSVKYFHQTNVHLQEMLDEQARYIAEGVTDYVVTRGKQPDSIAERYELVATADAPPGFWYEHVYLYRLKSLSD
ncbi:MAG: hypothetical protein GX418_01180 [Clostridiales bacterium]|nr:hypothetical protein [Clostridiales bacterium]